ncbi:MAG TPA: ABC transporter permease [Pyrinomonadaceae bacterium]|nr:ABC transporter permease [Pyrinomonadaceae bacterium]
MNTLWQDLRFGVRMLARNPIFTLISIVTLALGIGANTAIFSVVDAVLLRPLPYPEANRLVFLWETMNSQGVPISGSALPNYHGWRDQNQVFEGLGGFYYGNFNLSSPGATPETIQGAYITHNLFDVLRVAPAHGRSFVKEEEDYGKHRVILLSYGLWQKRFAGDHNVVGNPISVAGQTYTVVGVMPKGLPFFDNLPEVDLWAPISFAPGDSSGTRNNHFINLVGRLKPGVTIQQAQADTAAIVARMETESGNSGIGALVVPLQEQLTGESRTALLVLLGAVGFVLLVACVNVANLLLARASARGKELAIRASLGASRARIIRQVIIECLPLGIIGGLLGVFLALWGIDLLSSSLPATLPRGNQIAVNARVLGFTTALSLLAILIFGLLPALQSGSSDVRESLNEGGRAGLGSRKQGRIRRLLVISEVALALVLLIGSGLMVRSFLKLRQVNLGYTATNVLTMRVALPSAKYPSPVNASDPSDPAGLAFYEQLLTRIRSLPGVEAATAATMLPLGAGNGWGKFLTVEGREASSLDQVPLVSFALVSPSYFESLGINVQQGRSFTDQDTARSQQVAIINQTSARRFFPNEDPVGKTIWMGPPEHLFPANEQTPENRFPRRIVVGVVSDVKGSSLNAPNSQQVYVPLTQFRREGWSNSLMLAVKTTGPPESMTAAIRDQVRTLDPDQAITGIRTMDELLERTLSESKFALLLFGLFAGLAMVLAAIGIYGVMATAVTQRTHEIGLRMALGAQKRDVLRLIIQQAMVLVVIGIAAGLAAAVALTRLMSTLLFEVSATDPLTFALIALVLAVVALIASYVPAWRATKVDPLVALRYE